MTRSIGFMGLGIMGQAMAANLLRKGFPVMVYNRSPAKTESLLALGAKVSVSPAELAQSCEVVITMVTGPDAVDALLFGPDGAAQYMAGKVLLNASSVPPAYSRQLGARLQQLGATLVDAPVSGSRQPAEDATLLFLAGGSRAVVEELSDVFLAMGRKVVYCGAVGQGSMMKLTVNLLLGITLEAFAETVRFGEKGGLRLDDILEVFMGSPMAAPVLQAKAPMLRERRFPSNFPLRHMIKDMRFALDTAHELSTVLPVSQTALAMYEIGRARGLGDEDVMAVDRALREMLGD